MAFWSEYFLEKPIEPMCKSIMDDIKTTGAKYHLSFDWCKFVREKDWTTWPLPPAVAPSISLFSPQAGIYEPWNSVWPVSLNATVTPGTNPVTAVNFLRGAINIQTSLATTAVDVGPFTTNTTWFANATDGSLTSNNASTSIVFYQPYFYGVTSTLPVPGQALINSWTKVIWNSSWTITITFNSTDTDYIWFAIPATSASKTKRYVDVINNWDIGGWGNLFGNESTATVDSPTLLWSWVNYKFYISNYQSASTQPMQLKNA